MVKMGAIVSKISLPWWTSVLPFFVFHLGAEVSSITTNGSGSLFFFLPVPLTIIMIHWWGPRILVTTYLAAFTRSLISQGIPEDWLYMLIQVSHVPATAFVSWWLFLAGSRGKPSIPDIGNVLKLIVAGILIPVTLNSLYDWILHSVDEDDLIFIWTSDFASACALTLPALFFLTPILNKLNLTKVEGVQEVSVSYALNKVRINSLEITFLSLLLVGLSSVLPIVKYWYVLGVVVVLIAVRFGFGFALMANLVVFILSYLKPILVGSDIIVSTDMIEIHQGMCLLSLTAAVTGRVVSDQRSTERKLNLQNAELRRTHEELDRFVYSTSHDLSAPLKSILGLINISRFEGEPAEQRSHLDRMEKCVLKLDKFIVDILNYSRNSRLKPVHERISLKEIIQETLGNLQYMENFRNIKYDLTELQISLVVADRMRLRIILNNLISNAIRYHKVDESSNPTISFISELNHNYILIHVRDNGEGIREDQLEKIFEMFYRGTLRSSGSGLGLYIAKEAAEKMQGKITVRSVYGLGSNFTVYIPKVPVM